VATASINGITIGYDDEGAGAPLVLIHGHPFDRSMWAPQVAEFAGLGWQVIAPDLRGYGKSSVTPGTVDWSTFARDTAAVLRSPPRSGRPAAPDGHPRLRSAETTSSPRSLSRSSSRRQHRQSSTVQPHANSGAACKSQQVLHRFLAL
jgi:Alpha/beta hydrolase family